MLVIFDNVDEFLSKNQRSFDVNVHTLLEQFSGSDDKLQLVFISDEKIGADVMKGLQYQKLSYFSRVETHLFLSSINIDKRHSCSKDMTSFLQKSQQIFQLSGGCPALVEFLNMIRWID